MPHITEDRVFETCVPVATTAFTLAGAITGFRTFASQMAVNDTCYYTAQEVDAQGVPTGPFENGLATLTTATTLTRTAVIESSNANNPVTFGAGTVQVAIGLLAMRNLHYDNNLAVWVQAATAEPPTPPAGNMYLYAKTILPEHTVLKVKRPSGLDSPLQDSIAFNRIVKQVPSGTGNLISIGAANFVASGTNTVVTPSSGSAKTQMVRFQSATAATANSVAGVHTNSSMIAPVFRGAVAGEGGFRVVIRFALNVLVAGNRGFFGLVDVVAAPTNVDPTTSTTPGRIGLAFNANTGNLRISHNVTGTAPTLIDLGANFPINTTDLYELVLFARPFTTTASAIGYRVRRFTTASDTPAQEVTGSINTNIPAATTLLHATTWMTNNATAASCNFHFGLIAIESDY